MLCEKMNIYSLGLVWKCHPPVAGTGRRESAPPHLGPGSCPTVGEDTPESQFMVLVKGASGECAEAGPAGATGCYVWLEMQPRAGGPIGKYRSGHWEMQGVETHSKLAEPERGLRGLQGGKVQVLPTRLVPGHPQCADIASPLLALAPSHCPQANPLPLPGERGLSGLGRPQKPLWILRFEPRSLRS